MIHCNNCNKHKVDPENCEFILDSKNHINGISFKITDRNKSETYYIGKNDFSGRVQFDIVYKWQPILYYNKDKFFQTDEVSKEFNLNYTSPLFHYKRAFWWHHTTTFNTTKYLSIFCPVSEKEILLIYKNLCEHTTTVKYGWTMFCISSKYYHDFSKWSICTTQKPNEIILVSCNNNFNMYILNNNRVPLSLLNLSLSSMYQNKLNSALNLTKYVVPKTLSQQAPPCYLFHLSPFDLSIEST